MLDETQKHFFLTLAARSTCGRAKSKFPLLLVSISSATAGALLLANTCVSAQVSQAALAAAINSTNAATRFYAVNTLGKTLGYATISPLEKALHDPDACVRIAAAKALSGNGEPAAISSLLKVLTTEKDADVWNLAAKPLLDTGSAAIPALLDAFWKAETSQTRLFIGRALAKLGWKPQTQEEKIAFYASNILEHLDDLAAMGPVAIPSLVKLMAEGDEECRVSVMETLSCITDNQTFKPLIKALADPSPAVRKAAMLSLRCVCFDSVCKLTGNKGYLLLLAVRFLAPLVYASIKMVSYFRHRHNAQTVLSKGAGIRARLAKVLFSPNLLFELSCIASLLVFYIYTNHYIPEVNFGLVYGPLVILSPAIFMTFIFDIVRGAFKAAGIFNGKPGKTLNTARHALWPKHIAQAVWGAGIVYCFVNASLGYVEISNGYKHGAMEQKHEAAAQSPKKDALTPDEEARKFASIVYQAKEAVRAIDSRYLDQKQKEQVMDTFVELVSIRSPSKAEATISAELRRIMGALGGKEIDCRKGDTNAPFNLVMEFPASEDLKDAPGILLNAHIDTVAETTPEKLEFDTKRGNFYHRDNGCFGNDDKSGVTMVVEAVRTLKRDFWDKGRPHRRLLVAFAAQEEIGRKGAAYLAAHYREIFNNLDYSFTVDGWLWGRWGNCEYPTTPYLAGVFKSKADTFKARQITTIVETFAKERHKPVFVNPRSTELNTPIDATKFPPEAYNVAFFHTPNHGLRTHGEQRNNVGQLIDYVDMLVNVLEQLDEDYVKIN